MNRNYPSDWNKRRNYVFRKNPLCEICLENKRITKATEVDHILPIHQGGSHNLSNLRAICSKCHIKRHSLEKQKKIIDENGDIHFRKKNMNFL